MQITDIYGDLPTLETERLILRKVRELDIDDIFEYGADSEVSRYTTWVAHRSIEDTREFLSKILKAYEQKKIGPWGITLKESGKLIGTAGFNGWDLKQSRGELGYVLSRDYWKQGLMTEAVSRVIQFGFSEMKLVRIEARCNPENYGSFRVMEKCGMQFEGVLRRHILVKGKHEDVRMYSIISDDLVNDFPKLAN